MWGVIKIFPSRESALKYAAMVELSTGIRTAIKKRFLAPEDKDYVALIWVTGIVEKG